MSGSPAILLHGEEGRSSGDRALRDEYFYPGGALTCFFLLSPTPLRPGGALRRSRTVLLLWCHSLSKQRLSEWGQPIPFAHPALGERG